MKVTMNPPMSRRQRGADRGRRHARGPHRCGRGEGSGGGLGTLEPGRPKSWMVSTMGVSIVMGDPQNSDGSFGGKSLEHGMSLALFWETSIWAI